MLKHKNKNRATVKHTKNFVTNPRAILAVAAVLLTAAVGSVGLLMARQDDSDTRADKPEYAAHSAHLSTSREKESQKTTAGGKEKAGASEKKAAPAQSDAVPKEVAVSAEAPTDVAPKTFIDTRLYIDPWLAGQGRPAAIASQPTARWFGGWNPDVRTAVNSVVAPAAAQGRMPVLVAYNIPGRDCGSYSAGGAGSAVAYQNWIRAFAAGIGPRQAIVVLEPDALAGMDCLSAADRAKRTALIKDAVNVLVSTTNASVYIDAGNAAWHPVDTMAGRLRSAGAAKAAGFALNVSNFISTSQSVAYGERLGSLVGKRYVIDTSRNGNGAAPKGEWCNPPGRALGDTPRLNPGPARAAAYLWIKAPGESDGTCNGGPAAGVWWQAYAEELIANAR